MREIANCDFAVELIPSGKRRIATDMRDRATRSGDRPSLFRLALFLLLLTVSLPSRAETVASLPAPTGYVSDFANVIDPATNPLPKGAGFLRVSLSIRAVP